MLKRKEIIISLFFTGRINFNTAQKTYGKLGKLLMNRRNLLNTEPIPDLMTFLL